MSFQMEKLADGTDLYFLIRDMEDDSIAYLPTKYLMFKIRAKCSPNTVSQNARSLSYYLNYLEEIDQTIDGVLALSYDHQFVHFTEFLQYLKAGKHTKVMRHPKNSTCNTYLATAFQYFAYLKAEGLVKTDLKVLAEVHLSYVNSIGRRSFLSCMTFPGYLKKEMPIGRTIQKDRIQTLLHACTNARDRLLLLLLAETGYRIGEILGIRYASDLDLDTGEVRVRYREDNENGARAKNAEERTALISPVAVSAAATYLAEQQKLLLTQEYLFVILKGKTRGRPLTIESVYAMLRRLEKKTGIQATPHMLRHYFANERRKDGWGLELISKALGHRSIATTQRYLNIEAEELVQASEAYYEKHGSMIQVGDLF